MQVQVGVLPELIFKQVVMQVPFSSIPGFWGNLLGLRHCREDSVGMFALKKSVPSGLCRQKFLEQK